MDNTKKEIDHLRKQIRSLGTALVLNTGDYDNFTYYLELSVSSASSELSRSFAVDAVVS